MLARVKQDYAAGSVMAFSGREYVRSEWREVPAGFEQQAKNHPLLEVQPSLEEIRAQGPKARGLAEAAPASKEEAVTVETAEPPAESQPAEPPAEDDLLSKSPTEEPKPPRRRKRAAED